MNKAYLILGGNMGDRQENLNQALKLLTRYGVVLCRASSVYETEPWGMQDSQFFLNMAINVQFEGSPHQLLELCLTVEQQMGRVRNKNKYSSRIIDIDILFFNNEIISTSNLEVPHPRIRQRKFVLVPMVEINPDHVHPVYHQSVVKLLEVCEDKSVVRRCIP